jgi:hypothetical protein
MQHIEYDINVNPSPWQETFRSYMLEDDSYETKKRTCTRDNAAFRELTSAIKARGAREGESVQRRAIERPVS